MDEDEWETIFRVYDGDNWDSHDDYLSQERTARYGDGDDSQFRSWKLDQWNYMKIKKVGIYQVFFLIFNWFFGDFLINVVTKRCPIGIDTVARNSEHEWKYGYFQT